MDWVHRASAAESTRTAVDRPLAGRGVIVTRDESVDGPLTRRLRTLGATVWHWSTVCVHPPEDPAPLIQAVRNVAAYDWLVFSSQHAVTAVTSLRRRCPSTVRIAAVGSATAKALRLAGWPVSVVPDVHGGNHLVTALDRHEELRGRRILYPASGIACATIRTALARRGAHVDQVTAYEVRTAALDAAACLAAIESGAVHAITLTSPSAVDGLQHALGLDLCRRMLRTLAVAVIGPTTAAALASISDRPPAIAAPSTLDALADAVVVALHGEE